MDIVHEKLDYKVESIKKVSHPHDQLLTNVHILYPIYSTHSFNLKPSLAQPVHLIVAASTCSTIHNHAFM